MDNNIMIKDLSSISGSNKFHLHVDPSSSNQIATSWIAPKNESLISKMVGRQVQIRVIVLPNEIRVQELSRSNLSTTLSKLWGAADSVIADTFIPAELSSQQQERIKQILLEKEIVSVQENQDVNFNDICDDVKTCIKQITANYSQESLAFELVKQQIPAKIISGDASWKVARQAILALAEQEFSDKNKNAFFYSLTSSTVVNYIGEILDKKEFQQDPAAYLIEWKQKRGNIEEFRIPEDSARSFLKKLFA